MTLKLVQRGAIVALVLLALSGCATRGGSVGETGAVKLYSADSLPPPARSDFAGGERGAVVSPGDVLAIEVFGVAELPPREVRVDSAGEISYLLAGTVHAGGLLVPQVADAVARNLRAEGVRDPKVMVSIKEATSQVIAVSGQVNQPGLYPVIGDMSLMRAIASAHGLSEFASAQDVVVFRTVEGKKLAALYSLAAIQRGNYPDPRIYANDVIVVSENRSRRIFKDWLQVIPLLTTPIIVALQN